MNLIDQSSTLGRVRIGLVILHADASRGGAERYTLDVATALHRRGHEVSLIASSFGAMDAALGRVELPLAGTTKTAKYLSFLDRLDEHLADCTYDVVHAMLPVRRCDVYHPHAGLAVAAIEQGHEKHSGVAKPIAKLFNQLNPKRQRFAAVERELLSGAHPPLVICLSDYIRQAVKRYCDLDESRLMTLINAVDLAKFDPDARPGERERIRKMLELRDDDLAALMVAQDFERKGLREAILAMRQTQCEKLKLVVVGKDNAAPYQKLARSLQLADRVRFVGSTDDVYAYYRAADFFVLPTKHDPCSLVVLEALAMGLPVISTKQNGATEVMENGVDGFVLDDPTNVTALAEAMRRLCDTETRARMSAACLARRGRLSFDHHMDALVRIYQNAIQRRSAK